MRAQTNASCGIGMQKSFTKAQEATGRAYITIEGGKASSSSGVAAVALDMAKKKNVEKINRKLQ